MPPTVRYAPYLVSLSCPMHACSFLFKDVLVLCSYKDPLRYAKENKYARVSIIEKFFLF